MATVENIETIEKILGYNLKNCVTKIKNCSRFMRVDRFLIVWSLLSLKKIYFTKICGTKKNMARNLAAPFVYANAPLKKFSKGKIIKNLNIFGKPVS
jgi:hypothetical protein